MIHVRTTDDVVSSPRVWRLASRLFWLGLDALPGEQWTLNAATGGAVPPQFPEVPLTGDPELDDAASNAALAVYAMRRAKYHLSCHVMDTINNAICALPPAERARYLCDPPWARCRHSARLPPQRSCP